MHNYIDFFEEYMVWNWRYLLSPEDLEEYLRNKWYHYRLKRLTKNR
jgi:hypothetical protein